MFALAAAGIILADKETRKSKWGYQAQNGSQGSDSNRRKPRRAP